MERHILTRSQVRSTASKSKGPRHVIIVVAAPQDRAKTGVGIGESRQGSEVMNVEREKKRKILRSLSASPEPLNGSESGRDAGRVCPTMRLSG